MAKLTAAYCNIMGMLLCAAVGMSAMMITGAASHILRGIADAGKTQNR